MMQHVRERGEWSRPGGRWGEDRWTEVTPAAPCAVCGASAGCDVMRDEAFLRCTARPSARPMTEGGWLHSVAAPPVSESPAMAGVGRPDTGVRR